MDDSPKDPKIAGPPSPINPLTKGEAVMNTRGLITITAILLTISSSAFAQFNIPADIKAKLNGFVGKWEVQEEWKSSPSSDPAKVSGQWEARWVFDSLIEWRATFLRWKLG